MKVTDSDIRYGIIKTFLEYYGIDDLAEMSVNHLNNTGHGVELESHSDYGFTVRATADRRLDDDDITEALIYAIHELIEQNSDDIVESLYDNYDVAYDPDDVDVDFVQTYFDWSRSGRLTDIELDL